MNRLWFAVFSMAWCVGCSSSSDDASSSGSSGTSGDGGTGNSSGGDGTSGTIPTTPTRCAAPPCSDGDLCIEGADCSSNSCVAGHCDAPTCADKAKNGKETDVDCGGVCVARCAVNKACLVAGDCIDGKCTNGLCAPPTGGDKLKNGNETDVDCGSSTPGFPTNAGRCDAGKQCKAGVDCKSGGCNVDGKCAWARSCTVKNGGTTCGTGEDGLAQEDCCASSDVPVYNSDGYANTTAFRLDKYQITSGRIRRFLDAVNGNVQGWVAANRTKVLAPEQVHADFDKYLPTGWTQGMSTDTAKCTPDGTGAGDPRLDCNYGALAQVSGYRYNNEPGGDGGYGCNMGSNAYGARTFYLTPEESAAVATTTSSSEVETQHVAERDRVEQRAMNCANYFILAAFCAWDGGRLETLADYNAAYGGNGGTGRKYPWGSDAATRALGFSDALNTNPATPIGQYAPRNDFGVATPPNPTTDPNAFSIYNPAFTADQKALLVTRLQRANYYFNYLGMIGGYFQELGIPGAGTLPESTINMALDQSIVVAPPGRYPQGAGRYGHRDLAGNLIEITATPHGSAAISETGRVEWARNGSYEISHVNATTMIGGSFDKPMLTKYARAGGRCARPYPTAYLAEALP